MKTRLGMSLALLVGVWISTNTYAQQEPERKPAAQGLDSDMESLREVARRQGFNLSEATPSQVRQAVQERGYRPALKEGFLSLPSTNTPTAGQRGNEIVRAVYQATLTDGNDLSGEVQLQFSDGRQSRRRLGRTNLQQFQLLAEQQRLTLGQTADETLFVLTDPGQNTAEGYWIMKGRQQAGSLVFDLQLPTAVISKFQLKTAAEVLVNSPNSLVRMNEVITDGQRQYTSWVLYPDSSGRLTINCSSRATEADTSERTINASADYLIDSQQTSARWNLSFSPLAPGDEFQLPFSTQMAVQSVVTASQTPLPFDWDSEARLLTIQNKNSVNLTSLVITAVRDQEEEGQCHLPILSEGNWRNSQNGRSGTLKLSTGTIRAGFATDLTIQESDLQGLMETDVEFASDGSQRLTLEQYAADATARFMLLSPEAVLQEDIVTLVNEDSQQIESYLQVECRSGTTGQLRYQLPQRYRITSVRELDTQSPLLFRLESAGFPESLPIVEITLSNPLKAGTRQLLQIEMQATSQTDQFSAPVFHNPDHLRLTDVVVVKSELVPNDNVASTAIDYAELRNNHPWLPAGEDGLITFDRDVLPALEIKTPESSEVYATIDHFLTVDDQIILERIQLSLTGSEGLPPEMILQTAGSANLQLQATDENSGITLQRNAGTTSINEWTLTFPVNTDVQETTVILEARRPASRQNLPTLIRLPFATVRSANLSVENPSSSWALQNSQQQIIPDTMAYPENALESDVQIVVLAEDSRQQQLRGLATWLLQDSHTADLMLELCAFGFPGSINLTIDAPDGLSPNGAAMPSSGPVSYRCLVNGRLTSAEFSKGQMSILLPTDQESVTLHILLRRVPLVTASDNSLQIPVIQAKGTETSQVATEVVPPTGWQLHSVSSQASKILASIDDPRSNRYSSTLQNQDDQSIADFKHFQTRLAIRRQNVETLFFPAKDQQFLRAGRLIRQSRQIVVIAAITSAVFLALILLVPPGRISWIATGLGLLTTQACRLLFPDWSTALTVITAAVAAAGAVNHFRLNDGRERSPVQRLRTILGKTSPTVTTWLVVCLMLANVSVANGQDPDVLVDDPQSPFVYLSPKLQQSTLQQDGTDNNEPLFLSTRVQATLLNRDSLSATFEYQIALDSAVEHRIPLPVDDVTLVRCELNGEPVLPVRSDSGSPAIAIPATSESVSILDPEREVVAKMANDWVGGFRIHRVQYTIRLLTRPNAARTEAQLPMPVSPVTTFGLLDKTNSLIQAELQAQEPFVGVRLGNEFNFPEFSESKSVRLQLQFADDEFEELQDQQSATVVTQVMVTPASQRLSCLYEVRPADLRSEGVRLIRPQGTSLVTARMEDGTELSTIAEGDSIVIPVAPDRQGVQKFRIEWQATSSLSQLAQIDMASLATVNRIPADQIFLVVGSGSRYAISRVTSQNLELEPLDSANIPRAVVPRPDEQVYQIPNTTKTLEVQLVRLLETSEANLRQTVRVEPARILWKCDCEFQLPGEPVFRQSLRISKGVKIRSITAVSNETDRLQSWYRSGDRVIVCLREATRETLLISIEGVLQRAMQKDTLLPVIELPESVAVFDSSLEISAAEPDNVFIRSLQGATPNEFLDTQSTPVPTTPLRLTVIDERSPVILRAEPRKAARLSVVGLLTTEGDQNRLSLYYAFEAVESPFELQLTRPANVAYATSQVFSFTAEGSVLESSEDVVSIDVTPGAIEDNNLAIVAITGIVPALTSNITSLPLPSLNVPFEVTSLQILDGRSPNGVVAVPRWVRDVLPSVDREASPGNTNPLAANLNEGNQELRIRLPDSTSPDQDVRNDNSPSYTLTTHSLQGDSTTIEGTTGILAFSASPNARLLMSVPEGLSLIHAMIDGKASPIGDLGKNQIEMTLDERATFVELHWRIAAPRESFFRSATINVPRPINVAGGTYLVDRLPRAEWKVLPAESGSATLDELANEITTGLQLIGSANVEQQSDSIQESVTRLAPLTNSTVWNELQNQSASAASSFEGGLNRVTQSMTQPLFSRVSSSGPVIRISRQLPMSSLITILAGLCMLFAGVASRQATTSPTSQSSQAAEDSRSEAS